MISTDKLLDLGAALATAQITCYRVDSTGYGEFDLTANGRAFMFAVDDECTPSLWLCDEATIDVDELNKAIDWREFNDGKLYAMIAETWSNAAGGPYYDFWLDEYIDETAAA